MKEWYQQTKEEILGQFQVTEQGLTSFQAEKILAEKGENVLEEGKRKSTLQVFLEQFCDLLVVILIIAALISMVSGNVESTVVILAVIILNAILGTVQHAKAEKSLDSLKSLSSPNAKVLRDGQKVEIPSAKVVPGDILYLEAGDLVVADGRILENYSLQVNESSLTGESANVDKSDGTLHSDCALADRANMVYSSGLVTYGRAVVLVTATGMDTEIGKIAALMNATKEKKTPLQVSLDQFGSRLAMAIMVICALVFLLSLYRKMPVLASLMFAVALAVAACGGRPGASGGPAGGGGGPSRSRVTCSGAQCWAPPALPPVPASKILPPRATAAAMRRAASATLPPWTAKKSRRSFAPSSACWEIICRALSIRRSFEPHGYKHR